MLSREEFLKRGKAGQAFKREFVSKALPTEREDGSIRFVFSNEEVDRMGDSIKLNGWQLDNFKANPVILWMHDHSKPPIGQCSYVGIEGSDLVGDILFDQDDFSRELRAKVLGGSIRACSVGLIPLEWTVVKDEQRLGLDITSCELLEVSLVTVPANPTALARSLESHVTEKAKLERRLKVLSHI